MLQQLSVGLIFFGAMLINAITGFAGNLLAMPGTIQLIGMTDAKVVSTIVGLFSCFIIAMVGIRSVVWHEVFKNHAVYDPWDRYRLLSFLYA